MILIFDLDDTLYSEHSFVLSGLRAVARYGSTAFGLDPEISFAFMRDVLDRDGRGRIFNLWLKEHGLENRKLVAYCIKIYRHHQPDIAVPQDHLDMLERLRKTYPLYLVTDGHKIAQQQKCEALEISPYFRRMFITHRYGIANAKPSPHCFEKIRQAEDATWNQLLYVGDNPAKDFVNLNKAGAVTVRVHTGAYAEAVAKEGYDATHHITRLIDFEPLLKTLDAKTPEA